MAVIDTTRILTAIRTGMTTTRRSRRETTVEVTDIGTDRLNDVAITHQTTEVTENVGIPVKIRVGANVANGAARASTQMSQKRWVEGFQRISNFRPIQGRKVHFRSYQPHSRYGYVHCSCKLGCSNSIENWL